MSETDPTVPRPDNEPVLDYAPGSPERSELMQCIADLPSRAEEVPAMIGGCETRTGDLVPIRCPHDHEAQLGSYHRAPAALVERAVAAAASAWPAWSSRSWEERADVFLRAAELLSGPYRQRLNAATIVGQSKSVHQAEIDAACELVDFWRFNAHFLAELVERQPGNPDPSERNSIEYRGLEGFVLAATPFNFTSIAGNLATAPALMGSSVIWKPASSAVLSAHVIMELLKEAGLPDGVINMLPGRGRELGEALVRQPDLAGINFTGSTETFRQLWGQVGCNISNYRSFPRLVGETGGKDFVFVHPSADLAACAAGTVRGAFEYQGQKCSAASRLYVPRSVWPELRDRIIGLMGTISMGDPADFSNFMGAVIDEAAFNSISGYIDYARADEDSQILAGGEYDSARGWFISPTLVETSDPHSRLMTEEIFGPVLTAWVYDDDKLAEALRLVDSATPYALTGAVFATDRKAVAAMSADLKYAAGNFYINDKPTGAVVGRQPFGGGRASGTNDKAGTMLYLARWATPRTIKENLTPPTQIDYPHMHQS